MRHYTQDDEKQVVDLWNRTCIFDPIDTRKFRRQAILDENFDVNLSWVAVAEGRIVGFIYGTRRKFPYLERGLEPERGWINVLFVECEYQHRGIGSKLLENCEKALKKAGSKNIILGSYSPNYFFPGIDAENYSAAVGFFEKHGYVSKEEHYSMGKNLHGYQIPKDTLQKQKEAEKKGYKFIGFQYVYALELLEFLKCEFGGGWKRNALLAMQKEVAEDVILLVLDNNNKICGFCMRAIDGNPMRFGPIGVAESARNAGIGSILLDIQCYEMCKKGIYRMYFITTDELGKRYYERHGLQVFRNFLSYEKCI
ncbi:MAG: GNAT family N-acetyltransferase [Hespellia sp.]|nr:GNAT family N-acetyltransferase [Hespellia sp.]